MNLTLAQIFGANAHQDADILIVRKTDLLDLLPQTSNTAESLLAAIIYSTSQHFQGSITTPSGEIITDSSGNPITYDNTLLYDALNVFQWQRVFVQQKIRDCFVVEELSIYGN